MHSGCKWLWRHLTNWGGNRWDTVLSSVQEYFSATFLMVSWCSIVALWHTYFTVLGEMMGLLISPPLTQKDSGKCNEFQGMKTEELFIFLMFTFPQETGEAGLKKEKRMLSKPISNSAVRCWGWLGQMNGEEHRNERAAGHGDVWRGQDCFSLGCGCWLWGLGVVRCVYAAGAKIPAGYVTSKD